MLDDTHDWHDTLSLTQLFSFRLSRSEFYGNKLVGATVLKSNLLINKGYNMENNYTSWHLTQGHRRFKIPK